MTTRYRITTAASRRLRLVRLTLLTAALSLYLAAPSFGRSRAAPPEVSLPITDHGAVPLTATSVAGAATGNMPDGTPRTWAVVSGKPAYLAEIDPMGGDVVKTYPLAGAGGAWGVELADDGTVWVATYGNGDLFYLPLGAGAVVNAGRPHEQASFLWQVDTDADGVAYTGSFQGFAGDSTLPPSRMASYDAGARRWRDYGAFGEAFTYTRATAVVGRTVYVGMGATAAIFAVDIDTGAKTPVPLPEGLEGCQFAYEMSSAGTNLWVRFDCTKKSVGYVYDTLGKTWAAGPFEDFDNQRVGRDAAGNTWFTRGGTLHRFGPDRAVTATKAGLGGKGVGVFVSGGKEYVAGMSGNGLARYDIATGETERFTLDLPGTPTTPRSAVRGPGGRLHFGGYFSGGFATFDPATGGWDFDPRLGQTEGFATVGNDLYAGRYPGARIDRIDPTRPLEKGNPAPAFDLTREGQDRPFALTDAGGLLAVGTVAGYGGLQGALAIHDPKSGSTDRYVGLIPDHSVTALAYADGVLYGGTSVYGGNGADPKHANARVFAFDLAKREATWSVEVVGHGQVTSLALTPGGRLWAGTKGTLHSFNADDGRQVAEHEIAPFDWGTFPGGNWQGTSLAYDPGTERLYGAIGGKLIRIRPVGRPDLRVLAGGQGRLMVLGPDDRVYWVEGQRLRSVDWRELN